MHFLLTDALAASGSVAPVPERARVAVLQPAIDEAAAEHGVPRSLLSAMVWEASRYDPDLTRRWAGYGPLDLRDGQDPDVERAAALLGVSADRLIADARDNVRGGAALLADAAARANGGVAPDPDLLEDWWPAVAAFSGSHDPTVQRRYAEYVFRTAWEGVHAAAPTGEVVALDGVPVDLPGLLDGAGGVPLVPDFPGAYQWLPACGANYTDDARTGADIEHVVIHDTEGSYSGTLSWFQNCSSSVSAHYVVRSSDGQVTQMVAEEDVAWHAGNWTYNTTSVGIEHEGFLDDPETWYTDAMYEASAAIVADLLGRTGVLPDRNHVIAHSEVPGATHTDPGPGWDWDHYMALVEGSWVIAGDLTGVVAAEDVFTGARVDGALVTLVETGESMVVGDDGTYLFPDLPEGDYTVVATAAGYDDGTCEKAIDASGTWWCSIALFPSASPGPSTSGGTDEGPPAASFAASSSRVPLGDGRGCGCATGGSPAVVVLLAPLVVLLSTGCGRSSDERGRRTTTPAPVPAPAPPTTPPTPGTAAPCHDDAGLRLGSWSGTVDETYSYEPFYDDSGDHGVWLDPGDCVGEVTAEVVAPYVEPVVTLSGRCGDAELEATLTCHGVVVGGDGRATLGDLSDELRVQLRIDSVTEMSGWLLVEPAFYADVRLTANVGP